MLPIEHLILGLSGSPFTAFSIHIVQVCIYNSLNSIMLLLSKRSYTDTANFTLRCGVCQVGLIGQKVNSVQYIKACLVCFSKCGVLLSYDAESFL